MTTVDPAALSDAALCEQHPAASAALPGQPCRSFGWDGAHMHDCPDPAEWALSTWGGDTYCTRHAAIRLRFTDEVATRGAGAFRDEDE